MFVNLLLLEEVDKVEAIAKFPLESFCMSLICYSRSSSHLLLSTPYIL